MREEMPPALPVVVLWASWLSVGNPKELACLGFYITFPNFKCCKSLESFKIFVWTYETRPRGISVCAPWGGRVRRKEDMEGGCEHLRTFALFSPHLSPVRGGSDVIILCSLVSQLKYKCLVGENNRLRLFKFWNECCCGWRGGGGAPSNFFF